MISLELKEQLRRLKEKVFKPEYDDSSKQHVAEFEKRIEELGRISDFSNLAVTKEIIAEMKKKLKDLIVKKINCDVTKTDDLRGIEIRIQEMRYFISLLTPNFEAEIDNLQKIIIEELSE